MVANMHQMKRLHRRRLRLSNYRPFTLLICVIVSVTYLRTGVSAAVCLPAGTVGLGAMDLGSQTVANWYDYYSSTSHFPYAKDGAVAMAFGYTLASPGDDRIGFLCVNDKAGGPSAPNKRVTGNITFSSTYNAATPFTMLADDAGEWVYTSATRVIRFDTTWPYTNTDGLALDRLMHSTQNNYSFTVTYQTLDAALESVDIWTFPAGTAGSAISYSFGRSQLLAGIRFDLVRIVGAATGLDRYGVNMIVPPQSYPVLNISRLVPWFNYSAVLLDVSGSSEDYNAWDEVVWSIRLERYADGWTVSNSTSLASGSTVMYVMNVRSGDYKATVTMTDKCGTPTTKTLNVTVCASWMFMCGPELLYNVTVTPSSGLAVVGTSIRVSFWTNVEFLSQLSCLINGKPFAAAGLQRSGYIHSQVYVPSDWDAAFAAGMLPVSCSFLTSLGTLLSTAVTTDRNTLSGFFDPPVITTAVISPSTGWAKIGATINVTLTVNSAVRIVSCSLNGHNVTSSWQVLSGPGNRYLVQYSVTEGDVDVTAGGSTIACMVASSLNIPAVTWDLVPNSLAIDANKPQLTISLFASNEAVMIGDWVNVTLTSTMGDTNLIARSCRLNGVDVTASVQNFLDGRYVVPYRVQDNDTMWFTGNLSGFACTMEDPAGNSWTGTALPTNQLYSFIACAPGTSWPSARYHCYPCAVGRYSASINAPNCSLCAAGSFTNVSGSPACIPCSAGMFQISTGQSSCAICPKGSVTPTTGMSQCNNCSAGYYQPNTGQSGCLTCPVGSYSSSPGSQSCTICPVGTVSTLSPAASVSACRPCVPGYYYIPANGTTAAICLPCPPGYYSNVSQATSCAACPAGTANPKSGSASIVDCSPCPCNSISPGASSVCAQCPAGSYSERQSASCTSCNSTLLSEQDRIILDNSHFDRELAGWTTNMGIDQTIGHPLFGSRVGYSPVFRNNGSQFGYLTQKVSVNQNGTYTLVIRAFSRTSSDLTTTTSTVNSAYGLAADIFYKNPALNLPTPRRYNVSFSTEKHDWQLRSLSIPFVSAIDYLNVTLFFAGFNGTAWFDDVSITVLEYTACVCAPKYYYSRDYASCQPCPTGHSCCSGQVSQCKGQEMAFGQADACISCLEGWICSEGVGHPCNKLNVTSATYAVNNKCQACPLGAACKDGKARTCLAGTASDASQSECTPCLPGTFSAPGSTQCTACSAFGMNATASGFVRGHCTSLP